MKKITTLLTLLLTILLSINASAYNWGWSKKVSGNGNVTKEVREVKGFDGIKASAGINVYLFEGDEEKVVVEADENLQECIITKLDGGVLKCYIDCRVTRSKKMNVYVNYTKMNSIKASSGSDVYGESVIKSDNLELDASSGADIKIEIEAGTVNCDASSGGDAVLKGKAKHFDGNASSGADIKAEELIVNSCKANASS